MRRFGYIVAALSLLCAVPAWAQSEMEIYQATGDRMLEAHREVTQRNINEATKALNARDYRSASKYAQAVTRADPKRVEAWLLLGAAQIGLQDWKRAGRAYTSAVRLSPIDPQARGGLGVAMAHQRDPKAQQQLDWFTARSQTCGARCADFLRYKAEVEAAMAEAARGA